MFGEEIASVRTRVIPKGDPRAFYRGREPDVWVNHSNIGFVPNPGKLGLYALMFPRLRLDAEHEAGAWHAVRTYHRVLCNSRFSCNYARQLWDLPATRFGVILPPVGDAAIRTSLAFEAAFPGKRKLLVSLARFVAPPRRSKNQHLIIQAFERASARCPELRDWELVIAGSHDHSPATEAYVEECRRLAARVGSSIQVVTHLSYPEVETLLTRAFAFVHAAGAGSPPGVEPYHTEHVGLAIAEAMAHGCIPLTPARGGIFEVLAPGEGGIPYVTVEGMEEGLLELARLYGTKRAREMQLRNLRDVQRLGLNAFTETLGGIVREGLPV
jgi:glycosyltransferase involved in cell wall biosynthesis